MKLILFGWIKIISQIYLDISNNNIFFFPKHMIQNALEYI